MGKDHLIDDYKKRMKNILDDAYNLFLKKSSDYEDSDHPIRTFRLAKDLNIEPWKGCLLRMGDKISLLYTFVRDGKYSSHEEGYNETLLDIIIYASLASILYEMRTELDNLSMETLINKIRSECVRINHEI